jgi:hypothetical protein
MAFMLGPAAAAGAAGGAGGFGGLGAIVGLAGSFLSAAAAKQQADAQAEAAEYNAKMREIEAASERDTAEAKAEDFRRQEGRKRATAIAQTAASGVTLEGTPLLVDEAIVSEIELGANRLSHQGDTRATGLENQAELDRTKAKNYRKAGSINAGATLLSGFGSFF